MIYVSFFEKFNEVLKEKITQYYISQDLAAIINLHFILFFSHTSKYGRLFFGGGPKLLMVK